MPVTNDKLKAMFSRILNIVDVKTFMPVNAILITNAYPIIMIAIHKVIIK